MNPDLFKKLAPDLQQAVREAGRESSAYNLQITRQAIQEDFDRLKAAGLEIFTPDKAPFRAAVASSNEKFAEGLGGRSKELYQAVKTATGR